MTREELISSPEYWVTQIEIVLREELENYKKVNKGRLHHLAKKAGVSTSLVSLIYNGHKVPTMTDMVKILLALGKVPKIVIEELKDQK